jgi:hypothetical protein
MAYRKSNPLVKLVILGIVVFGAWRYGLPWAKEQGFVGGSRSAATGSPGGECVAAAESAVESWSRGVVRFVNPPIDVAAWSDFRGEVERRLDAARSACSCQAESCVTATDALRDLSSLLSDLDAAARSGGAPRGDLVRAQESLDLRIDEAWRLADAGK